MTDHETTQQQSRTDPQGKYANFQDPVGLVLRMLRSRNRAAYGALLRAGLQIVCAPLDMALWPLERRWLARSKSTDLPLLLIIGAPRSGTTLACQILARYLDVCYFTNVSAVFPRSSITASKLFRDQRRSRRSIFRSYYGQTVGFKGPSDAFHVWNRWWGDDRYQTTDIPDETVCQEIVRYFDAWLSAYEKPLLNKNNRNTECAEQLARILPNAYFVHVVREPLFNIQSLIIARQRIQGSKRVGWGLGSRMEADSTNALCYVDDVCDQVFAARDVVDRQRAQIAPDRLIEVRYQDICRMPQQFVRTVADSVSDLRVEEARMQAELRPLIVSDRLQLDTDELQRIRQRVAQWQESRTINANPDRWPRRPHDSRATKQIPLT